MLKRKSAKKRKHGHTWWHKRLDKKFGDWLRDKCRVCAYCHRPGYLVVSHVLPKGKYQGLRYDPVNVLPMHFNCHQFIWHPNPLEMRDWFVENYPARKVYLDEAKKIIVKRDLEYYQKVEKALDERNVKGLMVLI